MKFISSSSPSSGRISNSCSSTGLSAKRSGGVQATTRITIPAAYGWPFKPNYDKQKRKMMEKQDSENQALQLKERSTALIATLINPSQAREFERGLTIAHVVDHGLPLSEIVRETGFKSVAQVLDIHLTRLVAQFNLNNNISDAQIKTIVEDLIEKFPNESVEDFILCFKMARQNAFGVVYHLHSAVVFEWMGKYLEQKYEALEKKLRAEKAKEATRALPKDVAGITDVGAEALKEMQKIVEATKKQAKVPYMSDADIRRYGQEKPAKKQSITAGMKWFDVLGIKVLASDRKHAKQQIRKNIKSGKLYFGMSRGDAK